MSVNVQDEPLLELRIPPLPLRGSCQCGNLTYSCHSAPLAFYVCHCRECQKQSASGFGESLQVEAQSVAFAGSEAWHERPTASGRRMQGRFCPNCGTRISHNHAGNDQVMNLRAGTLDDTGWLVPAAHIFTAERQPWMDLRGPALLFEGPPDMEAIRRRWRGMVDAGAPSAP